MSKIKRFIEDISVQHGFDGEINDEVLELAQQELNKAKEALNKPIFIDYTIRADGRVELMCDHGVGHPSFNLTLLHRGSWNQYDGIHGCDGCCGTDAFHEAEERFSDQIKKG